MDAVTLIAVVLGGIAACIWGEISLKILKKLKRL